MESVEHTDNFYLNLPASIAVIGKIDDAHISSIIDFFLGSSRSGKTSLVARFLDQLDKVTSNCPPIAKLVICFDFRQGIYQDMIDSIKRQYPEVDVQVFSRYPEEQMSSDTFWNVPEGSQSMVIIDDLASQIKPSFDKMLRGIINIFFFVKNVYCFRNRAP